MYRVKQGEDLRLVLHRGDSVSRSLEYTVKQVENLHFILHRVGGVRQNVQNKAR